MILKWFFILTGLQAVKASFGPVYYPDIDPSECVQKILTEISKTKSRIADVSLINNGDAVVQILQGINGFRFVTRTESWANVDIYSSVYVLNFKNYNDMKNGFKNITMRDLYWNPFSNFVIIIEQLDDNLVDMSNLLVLYNVYNVSILRKEADDYSIYTFQSPIQPCHRQHLIRVAHCSKFNGGSNIFPMIHDRDFRGCHFKFAAGELYPIVIFNNKVDGFEERMLKLFSQRHNMTIELEVAEYHETEKGLTRNLTTRETLLLLPFLNIDGAIGGYTLKLIAPGKYFYAYPIFLDFLMWIMPRADFYDSWHAVFSVNIFVFLSIFLLIIIFSVLAYLLGLFPSREKDVTRDFLIVFGYFLNKITMKNLKHGLSQSIIACALLFSVFIIPYSIQAFLCSVQTHPVRGFEPKVYEDINKDKLNLVLPHDWPHNDELKNVKDCGDRMKCLRKVVNNKNRVYTRMSGGLFQFYKWNLIDETCTVNLYSIQEPHSIMLRTVYFRSGSLLVKPFDEFMHKYVSNGLFHKHKAELLNGQKLACRYRAKPKQIALNLADLYEPFALLIGGYCLSALCFAYEIILKQCYLNLR